MGEFSVTRRGGPLREALARITALAGREDAPTAAIQMLPIAEAMNDFVAQNPMPLLSADIGPKLWLGGAVRTQTHKDRDHKLYCVMPGRRRFRLFPPDQVATLYIRPPGNPPPLLLSTHKTNRKSVAD